MFASRSLLILLISMAFGLSSSNGLAIELSAQNDGKISLGPKLYLLEDKEHKYQFDEVRRLPLEAYQAPMDKVPNFGFSASVYWARIELELEEAGPRSVILEYGYPMADQVDFYLLGPEGDLRSLATGDTRHTSSYPIAYRLPAWPVDLAPGKSLLYVRLQSNGVIQFPLVLYDPETFQSKRASESSLLGAIYGIMGALLAYNLCLLIFSRNLLVLWYCLFIGAGLVSYSSQQGMFNFWFHGFNVSWWNNAGSLIFGGLAGFAPTLFAYKFLDLSSDSKWLRRPYYFIMIYNFVQVGLVFLSYNVSAKLGALGAVLVLSNIFVTCVIKIWEGQKLAMMFLFAWCCVIFGGIYYFLSLIGVLPTTTFSQFSISIGIAFENIFLSLAISFKLRRELSMALLENRRINGELREKDQARTLFFHNISHELRTPLNGILGFLELVRDGKYGVITEATRLQIEKSLRLAESLKIQVNTILDLAKSKRGELGLHRQHIDFALLFQQAQNLAEGLTLRYKNSSFRFEFDNQDSERNYISDSEQILTILRNLLGNAFKFSEPSRPNEVTLRCVFQDEGLLLEVRDQGIGIPGDFRDKIFDEFAQVQSDARRSYEGTGLGLAMVRDLVRLLGGQIHLHSELGVGSVFTVRIPSMNEVDPVIEVPEPAEVRGSLEMHAGQVIEMRNLSQPVSSIGPGINVASQNHFKILVVDDNETNCELIVDILNASGIELSYALSGRQALSLMRTQRPDLLLLDMMMPQMSGEDVLKTMRSDASLADIPVILLTARASQEDKLFGLSIGADDYLAKPIIAQELRIRVKNMLERHHLLQKLASVEAQEKLTQMGELFTDLSHELKNILHGSLAVRELERQDALLTLSPVSLSDEQRASLASGALQGSTEIEAIEQVQSLVLPQHLGQQKLRRMLRAQLIGLGLPFGELERVWGEINTLSSEELVYLETQLRMLTQHQSLLGIVKRTRELTLSVLTLSREKMGGEVSCLDEVWLQLQAMIQTRCRRHMVRVDKDLDGVHLEANPSKLMQILLNLTLNALDAVGDLPEQERWLRIESQKSENLLILRISNGGPRIPAEVQAHLFERGYSTKGESGSGIGLHLSQRLAAQMGGSLAYDTEATSPCFVLKLKIKAVGDGDREKADSASAA